MNFRKAPFLSLILLASFGIVAGCSGDSDDPPPVTTAPSKGTLISAEHGGKVTDDEGKATLYIPPHALAEDTEITLSVSPRTSDTLADIYDFGPDGLQFLKRVNLEIAVDEAAVGDKQVAIALETEGQFVPLSSSSYANGVVTAGIEHFSKFTVVFIEGKAQKSACDEADAAFVACGGDVTGTWVFESLCFAQIQDMEGDTCAEGVFDIEVDANNIDFSFNSDGSFTQTGGSMRTTERHTAPLSCFEVASCAEVRGWVCEGADECTCQRIHTDLEDPEEGAFSIDGNTVTITMGDEPGKAHEYCVQGDELVLRSEGPKGAGVALVTLKRK